MRILSLYLIKLVLLVALAVWLADHPGRAVFDWGGWRVETSLALVLIAVAVLTGLLMLLWRGWRWLLSGPAGWRRWRRDVRQREGYDAIGQGLIAVAAGDAAEARKQARRAHGLIHNRSLALMLTAQAAQLDGDSVGAREAFAALAEDSASALLGLRGLVALDLAAGDLVAARRHAERALTLKPKTRWVLRALVEIREKQADWTGVLDLLPAAAKIGALADGDTRTRTALAALAQSRRAELDGRLDEALTFADRALEVEPTWLPAVIARARILVTGGKGAKATALIERLWPSVQHPDLARLHHQAAGSLDALAHVKRAQRLVDLAPDAAEGHLALAQLARDAKLWGEARRHFEKAAALAPGAQLRAWLGLAELEEAEGREPGKATGWRTKALSAPREPHWQCTTCGAEAEAWDAGCTTCGSLGSIAWADGAHPHGLASKSAGSGMAQSSGTQSNGALPPPLLADIG